MDLAQKIAAYQPNGGVRQLVADTKLVLLVGISGAGKDTTKQRLLQDPEFARINSILTLHVAGYAMAEIANLDPKGRAVAAGMCDGTIGLKVQGGPELTFVIVDHKATIVNGDKPKEAGPQGRHAFMVFSDLDVTGQILRAELASFTAIGREALRLGGYVPLLENMNKILGLVPFYLS